MLPSSLNVNVFGLRFCTAARAFRTLGRPRPVTRSKVRFKVSVRYMALLRAHHKTVARPPSSIGTSLRLSDPQLSFRQLALLFTEWMDNDFRRVSFNLCKVILQLQAHPELGTAIEHLGQTHGHFRRNPALPV